MSDPFLTAPAMPAYYDNASPPPKISVRHLNFFYGSQQALFSNNLDIAPHRVTAIIGPSGCGKSTHIRVYNRIYELYPEHRAQGEVLLDGQNILEPSHDLMELRRHLGMVFQRPIPFPLSIYDNIAFGLHQHYRLGKSETADWVEEALRGAALVGRSQGYPASAGDLALGRAAAALVHRPGHRGQARSPAHG
jgi:ABC-type phosphate transport system ATPase subunit